MQQVDEIGMFGKGVPGSVMPFDQRAECGHEGNAAECTRQSINSKVNEVSLEFGKGAGFDEGGQIG